MNSFVMNDTPKRRQYKYYDLVMATFVTVLICSNIVGAAKVSTAYGLTFGAGVLFFPISYIFNDYDTDFTPFTVDA